MFCHGFDARLWYPPTAKDIPQKWADIGLALGATKTNQEDGIKWLNGTGHERE